MITLTMEDVRIYILIGVAVAFLLGIAVSCYLWKIRVCKNYGKNDLESQTTNEANQESHHELLSTPACQSSILELQSNEAVQTFISEQDSKFRTLQKIDTYVCNRNRQIHSVSHVTETIDEETLNVERELRVLRLEAEQRRQRQNQENWYRLQQENKIQGIRLFEQRQQQIRLKEAEQRRQQQDQENFYRLQQENKLQGVRLFEQRQQQYPQQRGRQRNRKRNQGKRQRSQSQGRQPSQSNSRSRTDFPEKTIDLHNLSVRDAMQQFTAFVRQMEEIYLDNNFSRKDRYFYVITGRGKHSHGGIPKIKPAVQGYLDKHDYVHEWKNEGMVMTDLLSKRDLLSENLQVPYC